MSWAARARAMCLLPLLFPFLPIQMAQAAGSPPSFAAAMQTAAQARHVPLALIEATAYVNTRWEWIASPAHNGGVGPMNVKPSQLSLASSRSGDSATQIKTELGANLDAGAGLLANYHSSGTDLASWRPAVVTTQGPLVADEIFTVMGTGASRTTSTGETITLAPQTISTRTGGAAGIAGPASASTDYPPAVWVPADPSNYSVANRAHDYPIDMIVIHDIEGSAAVAIQDFQTPGYAASAHYVISYEGQVTQMVLEKDIAWHAGNWDYNTRAIGIEHAGFAYTPGLYTTTEYNASAALAASICSRWGVPMDRTHVIGHFEVPDPNNPGQFGGADHHTDPGPYWDWTYYMATAQSDALGLSSPPHLMPDPVATSTANGVTVTWQQARTCRKPISGYTVTGQPGNLSMTLPATARSATFSGLQLGTRYTFTVTAQNADGQDSQTANPAIPGACTSAGLTSSPASPQVAGAVVQLTGTSIVCPNPLYEFWMLPPGGAWTAVQQYSSGPTFSWNTTGAAFGGYSFAVWARDASSPGAVSDTAGTYDARASSQYALTAPPCTAVNASASPVSSAMAGTQVTVTGSASGCSNPLYEVWLLSPSGTWTLARGYSTNPTFGWNTAGETSGAYRISVWARDAGSAGTSGAAPNTYDAVGAFQYALTAGCASMTASAAPPTSAAAGTMVTITGSATGCPSPLYEFWVLPPGGSWTLAKGYSTSNSLSWNTTGKAAGTYRFSVWAQDASRPGGAYAYDAFSAFNYTLTTTPCTAMSAAAAPPTSAGVGTAVTITGSATGCPNPLYEFWMLPPGGSWTLAQGYTTGNKLNWTTSGNAPGTYRFSVWARDLSSPGTVYTYDVFSAFNYSLTTTPCTGMSASAAPPTSAAVGTTVTITGSATGCPNPLYEFWVLPPGGSWTLAQGYSTSATLAWNTAGNATGTYRFSVWARDASSPGSAYVYDVFSAFQYALS